MAFELDKPLRRSTDNAMITGVCGGLAKWLGWDPTVVRVFYVLLSLVSVAFPGILAYIILTVLIPRDDA
jgi:phage shock protein PspC (stress-responsive transcriptional regulator)